MSTSAAPAARTAVIRSGRLTRDARRDQLLDSAAVLLLERGLPALTMEGVAARAGVSKALPYSHFDNAEDLVHALRQRELERFGEGMVVALSAAKGFEERIAAAVHAYFEEMKQRGAVLAILLRSEPVTDLDSPDRADLAFFADLFQHYVGLSPAVARVASSVFLTGSLGAVDSWVRKVAPRATIEAVVVRLIVAGVEALAEEEQAGRLP